MTLPGFASALVLLCFGGGILAVAWHGYRAGVLTFPLLTVMLVLGIIGIVVGIMTLRALRTPAVEPLDRGH